MTGPAAVTSTIKNEAAPSARLFSAFELWPDALFYAPLVFYWLWLTVRHRGFTPSAANPMIKFGGFVGESKVDVFKLIGPVGNRYMAPWTSVQVGLDNGRNLKEARTALFAANLAYPIVAKPDFGKNGTGVRVVRDEAALNSYLKEFPRNARVILQKYIAEEGEAGVFYVRYPGEANGRIVSLTLKYLPRVTGDGKATLRELILRDPRASRIAHLYFARHGKRLDEVVPLGKSVRLLSVGNHCKGAIFKNGNAHITPAMTAAFDAICKDMPEYYFGRFDVRFNGLEDLKRGENFSIVEFNGAGSEMTHIWDADEKLMDAYRTLFYQYGTVFAIGAENRRRGFPTAPLLSVIKAWNMEHELLTLSTREE